MARSDLQKRKRSRARSQKMASLTCSKSLFCRAFEPKNPTPTFLGTFCECALALTPALSRFFVFFLGVNPACSGYGLFLLPKWRFGLEPIHKEFSSFERGFPMGGRCQHQDDLITWFNSLAKAIRSRSDGGIELS